MLRTTDIPSKQRSSAVDLLAAQPNLLEQLRKAHMGNYQIVLALLSSLDNGREIKRLVDDVIDSCKFGFLVSPSPSNYRLTTPGDTVVNLREVVIEHRIKYSVSSMDEKSRKDWLSRATRSVCRISCV
jgi:hypothetical protein